MSEPHQEPQPQPKKARHPYLKLFVLLVIFGAAGGWGIVSRLQAETRLRQQTNDQAIPTVAVIKTPRSAAQDNVVLPGTVQAWHEAPIYARTNGYLKSWSSDIGARVKAGDLLAEIETPEIDAELHQAEADLATAEANNVLAQSTAKRWLDLLKTNAVSKQDVDEKTGDAAAKEAAVAAARASLDRLHELEGFKSVTAPFDGIITARNTDTGALINAGSGGTGQALFHIAETDKLRVYVQVPELYTQAVTPDMKAELHFAEYPQRTFTATLTHTADAIDPTTRTLLIELAVDNDKGELYPGSYVETHMQVPSSGTSVHIPVNTLLFRAEGLQVATVGADDKVHLKTITIGRDYGKEVEVIAGLAADENVIVNPSDSLADGQAVHIAAPAPQDGSKP